ncbi:MAG: hypothetical protein V3R87_09130 [Dehalococcoidia bacterium]
MVTDLNMGVKKIMRKKPLKKVNILGSLLPVSPAIDLRHSAETERKYWLSRVNPPTISHIA